MNDLAREEDLPQELIEQIQEQFPGMEIKFAGDNPQEIPEEAKAFMEKMQIKMKADFAQGLCTDCNKPMPGFPKKEEDWEGWAPAENWTWFNGPDENPIAWQCPECDANDSDDLTMVDISKYWDDPNAQKETPSSS